MPLTRRTVYPTRSHQTRWRSALVLCMAACAPRQRLGTQEPVRAPKDGYTLGVVAQAAVVMAPAIDPSALKYDALKDLQYLTLGYNGYFMLATHPSSGLRTIKQFFDTGRILGGGASMCKHSHTGTVPRMVTRLRLRTASP